MWKSIAGTRGYGFPGYLIFRISDFSNAHTELSNSRASRLRALRGSGGKKKFFLVLIENLFTNRQKCDTILADRLLGTLFLRQKLMEGEVKP